MSRHVPGALARSGPFRCPWLPEGGRAAGYNQSMNQAAASTQFQVAVVGAGLAGLASALGAAQAGLRVALIGGAAPELQADGPWDQRIYAISPASQRLLRALKVWDRLDPARVAPVRDMRIWPRADAARALHFSAYEVASEALAWIIEERELARVLRLALDFQHGVTRCEWDATAVEFGPAAVVVRAATGHALSAALLIGADGKHSMVRAAAGLTAALRSYGQHGVVANFRAARRHAGAACQWFTDAGVVALLPLPGQDCSLVWSAPDALAAELVALPGAELARRVAAVTAEHSGSLEPLGSARAFPLGVMTVPRIVAARLALVGDAAHLVHPLAGQGLNLGFQDVETLLEVLRQREPWRDPGDLVLLRRYERQRAVPVLAMRSVTDGLNWLFGQHQPLLRRAREDGLNLLQALPVIKKMLVRHAMGR